MKLLKAFSLLVFLFCINSVFGQEAKSQNSYVQSNINALNTQLSRGDKAQLKLSDAQVLKLEKIFSEKEIKFNKIINEYKDKGDLGKEFADLDKQYKSKIEAVLSSDQKKAFKDANQKSVMKTN